MNQDQVQDTTESTAQNLAVGDTQTEATGRDLPVEDSQPEPQTFPAEYVQELRAEAAEYRTRSKSLTTELVHAWAAADGRLLDPTDLPASAVDAGEDGAITRDAVSAAIDALVKAKPHLAKQRPAPLPQGATTTPEPVSLLRLLNR
jgi:hypothetical protein